ncbi:MAG: flagellar protein export ATPase FliI [Bdellovibrionales bacterium]
MQQHQVVDDLSALSDSTIYGRVAGVLGLLVEVAGVENYLSVGSRTAIHVKDGRGGFRKVPAEVVGFKQAAGGATVQNHTLMMPFGNVDGIGLGARVDVVAAQPALHPTNAWLGRIINALGEPIDSKGPLATGVDPSPLRAAPPPAQQRQRVQGKVDLGIRALNTFLTMCRGQRMGIFSGSGVGKSVLMSMIARYTQADVIIIGLVGERGREVQEFIQDDLGPEGLARSVVVVATSDEAPLLRRQAAYTTLAVAEHFRRQGKNVLCMIDSITRFAMAQREIGLSAGEPPTTKGYPPTTFSELARLLERAGPGIGGEGYITGLFTVLVDGDDHNEPIADAARGILDGHIVLDRQIAQRGRYPAVNVLKSISRVLPDCNTKEQNALLDRARMLLATYDNMAELIRLGAYRRGSDPQVDEAIQYYEKLENFLRQPIAEHATLKDGYDLLADILGMPKP